MSGSEQEPGREETASDALSLRPLETKILLCAGVVVAGLALAGRYRMIPGALCGAAIAFGNFFLIRKILERAFTKEGTLDKGFVVRYILKFLALVAAVWLAVSTGWFDVVGFLAGLSALFLGVLLEGLTRAATVKTKS